MTNKLRPTPTQYQEFGLYLGEAHSWYKHLPLLEGQTFVVFVAADAGFGRLVARPRGGEPLMATGFDLVTSPEVSEFTEANPRLHYGWKTTTEYRERFGYLDYSCWPTDDGRWARDAGLAVHLPKELVERCGFVLYPFVSATFVDTLTWGIHDEALQQLRDGAAHPAREQVLTLADLSAANELTWASLNESEQRRVVADDAEAQQAAHAGATATARRYLELDKYLHERMECLQSQEAAKIQHALTALDAWLCQQ